MTVSILKKMPPLRQIGAVELMVAMNKFTASYAQSLLAATPQAELVEPSKPKRIKGLTEKQMLLMQRESAKLDRQPPQRMKSPGCSWMGCGR